ncbi:MAG: hypothetical protein R3Y63_04625 [Eubacteriales bacterium]
MNKSTKILLIASSVLCATTMAMAALVLYDNKKHPSNFTPTRLNLRETDCRITCINQVGEETMGITLSCPVDCYNVQYHGSKVVLKTFNYSANPSVTSIHLETIKNGVAITNIKLNGENGEEFFKVGEEGFHWMNGNN